MRRDTPPEGDPRMQDAAAEAAIKADVSSIRDGICPECEENEHGSNVDDLDSEEVKDLLMSYDRSIVCPSCHQKLKEQG